MQNPISALINKLAKFNIFGALLVSSQFKKK